MDSNGSVERVLHDPDAAASPEEVSESEDLPESTTWYDSIMDHASRSKECDVADSVAQALWNPYSIYDSRQPIYHASFRQQDGHCDDFLAVEPHYHNCPYIRHARNQDYSIVHDRPVSYFPAKERPCSTDAADRSSKKMMKVREYGMTRLQLRALNVFCGGSIAREELDILYELFSAIADSNCKRLNRNQLVKAATNYVGEQISRATVNEIVRKYPEEIRFSGTGIAFPSFVRLLWILRKRIQRQVRPKARRQTHKQHPMAAARIGARSTRQKRNSRNERPKTTKRHLAPSPACVQTDRTSGSAIADNLLCDPWLGQLCATDAHQSKKNDYRGNRRTFDRWVGHYGLPHTRGVEELP